MAVVFRIIIQCFIFTLFIFYDVQDRVQSMGEARTYSADIIACHDAAIPKLVDKSKGYVVFDEVAGLASFQQSLIRNLNLQPNLTPTNNKIFYGQIKIVGVMFIGDDKVPHDASGKPIYPYTYSNSLIYRGHSISVDETLYGPSVIGIIEAGYNTELKPVVMKTAVYRYVGQSLN
ncbi:hypothetical protein SAMN04487897_10941 [Paenibacillus sp. yr247]|uniref:hypothetical protein n=1 Tax=Paenibacillus sp. yr247 TaxID=1761880 RepID=UPI00088D66C5|nr:hypothetical protein [Paenibacillus sp. yr247]SDO15830.1 hypothetical protein SAMN04487897_10941 [Paenibacillus sp. yr247]